MSMRTILLFAAVFAMAGLISSAIGHPATERYIPIGQSPGISGKYSYIGVIESADPASRVMMVKTADTAQPVQMNERTRIYLDRSGQRMTSLNGTYADCQPGRRVEVKFRDNDPGKPAEWVKVEAGAR